MKLCKNKSISSIAADSIGEDSNIPCHDYHGDENYDECAYEKVGGCGPTEFDTVSNLQ